MNLLWKNTNFLFLFLGRVVTNIGDSIYYVAAMWLVYELSGNAFYSGLAGFLILLPKSLQFLIGPLVDHWNLKRILMITQLLQCGMVLIIPIFYHMNLLNVQLVLIIMPIIALIEQFAYPSQTKALPLLLKKNELVHGNSLFAFAYQGIDLIFNALAGILVAVLGAVTLYIIDSFTFAFAALLFSLVKLPKDVNSEEQTVSEKATNILNIKTYVRQLKEGLFIFFHSLLAPFMIGPIISNFAIGATMAILPSFGASQGGSEVYGLFLAAISTGTLIGALSASFFGRFRVGTFAVFAFSTGSLLWFASMLVPNLFLAMILFGSAWIPVGATNIIFGAVIQTVVPNRMLGRVNSVSYSMSTIAMPLGSLGGGYAASALNPTLSLLCLAFGFMSVAIIIFLHPALRKLPKAAHMNTGTFHISLDNLKQ